MAGETWRNPTGRSLRQFGGPAWQRDRGAQPALVSTPYRARHRGRATKDRASGGQMDGGDIGWPGRGAGGGIRGAIHAAMFIFRAGGCGKTHGAAAAQYVGGE